MNIILRPWRGYLDFSGRSTRKEFWLFFVVYYGLLAVLYLAPAWYTGFDPQSSDQRSEGMTPLIWFIPAGLLLVAGILPSIAVIVRRLHDSDKSGWMYLLTCVPYIGFLFFIVFGCLRGTRGENSYGFDPRLGEGLSELEVAEVFG